MNALNTTPAEELGPSAGVPPAEFRAGPQGQAAPAPPQNITRRGRGSRRKRAGRDSVTSLVLGIHAEADRPLGFDRVVELSGNRVTRAQVSAASSALYRDGQLDRIRWGVYQWSGRPHAAARHIPAARRATRTLPPQAPMPSEPAGHSAPQQGGMAAAELFSQLFPSGVQITGKLLADLEQWARLTSKLASQGGGTAL